MKWAWVLVALAPAIGCKKGNKQPAEGSGSAEAPAPVVKSPPPPDEPATPPPAVQAPPPAGLTELLHSVPSTVRVSSRVTDRTTQPDHLVDKNLNTAWHSHSGDLQGAFIDIDIPGAQIKELRLTVGGIGKGVHGEDYFVMYPRIKTVSVRDPGGKLLAQKTLDENNRTMQPIVLASPASHVRLKIEDIVAGGKPTAHELTISELEAWGTPPAGAPASAKPRLEVGDPLDESKIQVPIADADGYCKQLVKDTKDKLKAAADAATKDHEQCIKDHGDQAAAVCGEPELPGDPQCSMAVTFPIKVNHSTWMGAGIVSASPEPTWGPRPMQVVVETQEGFWPVGDKLDCGGHDPPPCSLEITSATVGDNGNLVVGYHVKSPSGERDGTLDCAAGTNVTCTAK